MAAQNDQAALDALDAFERVPDEGPYDRVLGLARDTNTGQVVSVVRSKPDDVGQTQLFVKSGSDIQRELLHDNDAVMAPGFYDIDMKRAGKDDGQIVDFHNNNEAVLTRAQKMMVQAEPEKGALPTVDQALAHYRAPSYKAPAVDSDYVSAPAFSDEPAYDKTVGIARNMDGAPVALVATAPDKSGKPALVAMTRPELQQQLAHDGFAQQNPGFSDQDMRRDAYGQGLNGQASDNRIVDFHVANEKVLSAAEKQLDSAVASGANLPSVQDMAKHYQNPQAPTALPSSNPDDLKTALNGVDLKALSLGNHDGVDRSAADTGTMAKVALAQPPKSPDGAGVTV